MSDDDSAQHVRGFEKSKSFKHSHLIFFVLVLDIDKLLRFTLKQSQYHDEVLKKEMEKADSEKIKNKFDKRVYLLDTYKTILSKIYGYDFRYPNNTDRNDQEGSLSTEADTSSESAQGDKILESEVNDQQVKLIE